MARRKKSAFDALIELFVFVCKLLWWIITIPYRIYKCFARKVKKSNYIKRDINEVSADPIYQRKYLLTKHEWFFYKELKPIADKLGFVVLSKIRMADLVEPVASNNSEYYRAFGKVKAKHIDFVLCRPENLLVELLIELDDSTHTEGSERDAFVEKVYAQAGYKLFRTRTSENLEQGIVQALGDITMPKYSITTSPKLPKVEVPKYQLSQDKNTEDLAADFEKQFGFKPELEPQLVAGETKKEQTP